MRTRHAGGWLIVGSLVLALVLNSMPLPPRIAVLQPDWVCLALVYWCLFLSPRVGMGSAWVLGLLLDVSHGALLGQHALALVIVAFITLKTHRRLRLFPLWQQSLAVLGLLFINQVLVFWVDGISGYPPRDLWYLAPAVSGMLLWPWITIVLGDLSRRFQVV